MDKPPSNIWAFYDADIAEDNNGADIIAHDTVQHGGAKYTLTTHVAAQIESARAEGIRHGRREMRDAILALIDTPTYKEGV